MHDEVVYRCGPFELVRVNGPSEMRTLDVLLRAGGNIISSYEDIEWFCQESRSYPTYMRDCEEKRIFFLTNLKMHIRFSGESVIYLNVCSRYITGLDMPWWQIPRPDARMYWCEKRDVGINQLLYADRYLVLRKIS